MNQKKASERDVHITRLTIGFQPETLYIFAGILEILALLLLSPMFIVQSLTTVLISFGGILLSVIGLIVMLIGVRDERKGQ